MNSSFRQSVIELARRVGIQTSYLDTAGKRRHAAPETLAAILNVWGITVRNPKQIRDALSECKLNHWRKIIDPLIVVWDGIATAAAKRSLTPRFSEADKRSSVGTNRLNSFPVVLHIPAAYENQLANCTLRLEYGDTESFTVRLSDLRTLNYARVNALSFLAKELLLPAASFTQHGAHLIARASNRGSTQPLPPGYHHLDIEIAGHTVTSLLICAPTKSFSNPTLRKSWGAFLPMYAAHSRHSWGAGNFSDWQKLSDWIASLGGRVVSTLPLLAAFLDNPVCEPSPYSPASRLFWNEFYLDISAIPELSRCPAAQKLVRSTSFQRQLDSFRRNSSIDYRVEMAARRQVLEKLAHFFLHSNSTRRNQFSAFLRDRPLVENYAQFRAACDRTRLPWHKWPQRMRDGNLQAGDYSEAERNYHLYAQWLAHEQITALTKKCRARDMQFYLDLPLGVHPAGYDLWHDRDAFALGATVGAPPDAFFSKGQNWGFSPLHPQRLREQGYRYLREVLSFQMRHTGMLRLDHVMSLHRLYWIPQGHSAQEGAYVSYPSDEFYAVLNLESHRHKTVIVGENLGTVPDEVNHAMNRHGLRRMYVVQFAQHPNPRAALARPPQHSVASINTHDMPTFAAHWRGLDIDDRVKLGLLTKTEARQEHTRRAKLNHGLLKFLQKTPYLQKSKNRSSRTEDDEIRQVLHACLAWLRATAADLVLVNLEDLWAEIFPQNVPGTSTERPNWRRKAQLTVEEIQSCANLREILALKKSRRDTRK